MTVRPIIFNSRSSPPAAPIALEDDGGMFSHPPALPMHLAAIVAMAGMLDAFSAPGFFTFEALCFVLLCFCLCSVWLLQLALFVLLNRRRGRLRRSLQLGWRQWAAGPVIAMVTVSLIALQVPMRLRFAVSRAALNQLAQQAVANGPKPLHGDWGIMQVQRAEAFDVAVMQVTSAGEVDFRVPGTEFFRSYSGFAYCPVGNTFDPEGSFEPLGGPWYVWHTSW